MNHHTTLSEAIANQMTAGQVQTVADWHGRRKGLRHKDAARHYEALADDLRALAANDNAATTDEVA